MPQQLTVQPTVPSPRNRLDEFEHSGSSPGVIRELRRPYGRKVQRFDNGGEQTAAHENLARDIAARHGDVLERQSRAFIALNDRGSIDNQALRGVQNAFDLERLRLADIPDPELDDDEEWAPRPKRLLASGRRRPRRIRRR